MKTKKWIIVGIIGIVILLTFISVLKLHQNNLNESYNDVNTYMREEKTEVKKNKIITFGNHQFDIKAMFGFEGIIYGNITFPVRITVTNNGSDFEGTVWIVVPERAENKGISLVKDLKIKEKETKIIDIEVPNTIISNQCKIMILKKDEVVLEKEIQDQLQYDDQGNILLGVLSTDNKKFDYMDQMIVYRRLSGKNIVRKIGFSHESFPYSSDVLQQLDFILMDRFKQISFKEEQKEAFVQWIEQGGIVLCQSAEDYQALQNILKKYDIQENEKWDFIFSDVEFQIQEKNYKLGKILILPHGFQRKYESNYEKKEFMEQFFYEVIARYYEGNSLNSGTPFSMNKWIIERLLNFNYYIQFPSIWLYFVILILYIMCIAPVGYFVLKRMDRREWIGFWVISFVVIFYSIILGIGRESNLKEPVGTMIAFIDGSQKHWKETVYTSWINPNRYPYDVTFSKDYHYVYPYYDRYENVKEKGRMEKNSYFIKKDKDKTKILFTDSNLLERNYFTAEKQEEKQTEAFIKDLEITDKGIVGTLQNNTGEDLQDAGLYFGGFYVWLGTWKQGEIKEVTLEQNILREDVNDIDWYPVFTEHILEKRKQDLQSWSSYDELYFYIQTECDELEADTGYIYGIADHYYNQENIITPIKTKGRSLYYTKFKGKMKCEEGYIIPNIMLLGTTIQGDMLNPQSNLYYGEDTTMICRFEHQDEILELRSEYCMEELPDGKEFQMFIWNYRRGKYETVFQNSKTISGNKVKDFIKNDQMKIRFVSNGNEVEIPTISAIGGEKNVKN